MAYFEPYIDADGIHIPTYKDVLNYLCDQYKDIFAEPGEDVYLGEETPDYQLLSVFSKMYDDLIAITVDLFNSRNPNFATGAALDMLLPLNGTVRKPATYSKATLTLSGSEGIMIAAGSEAIDEDGNLWEITADVTIPSGGSATVEAICETPGAITAPAGTINKVYYPPTVGWTGVNNAENAEVGENVETDDEVRERRRQLFSRTANGTAEAITRALMDIDGVEFVRLMRNDTNVTDPVTNIPGHSICALVHGGTAADIVEAIWKNKAPGVGTYGGSNATYTDENGVSYTVYYTDPQPLAVTAVSIAITPQAGYDADRVKPMIKAAILDAINNLGIGVSWNVTTAYRDIYNAFSGSDCPFVISAVTGTPSGGSAQSVTVTCPWNQYLSVAESAITITDT